VVVCYFCTAKGANNYDHDTIARCRRLYLGLDTCCISRLSQNQLLVHCTLLPILSGRGTQNARRDRRMPETTSRSGRNTEVLQRPAAPRRSASLRADSRCCMDGQTLVGWGGRRWIDPLLAPAPRCAATSITAQLGLPICRQICAARAAAWRRTALCPCVISSWPLA
jgi:hypothetical protein